MRKLRVSSAILGLFLLTMVTFGMLVYYNYVGFGAYQQYKQVINFAAIVSVMITLVYIGSIASRSVPDESQEAQKRVVQTAIELERELLETARDYRRLMANSEDFHILTSDKSDKKHPKNHIEQLKERSMFDTDDFN